MPGDPPLSAQCSEAWILQNGGEGTYKQQCTANHPLPPRHCQWSRQGRKDSIFQNGVAIRQHDLRHLLEYPQPRLQCYLPRSFWSGDQGRPSSHPMGKTWCVSICQGQRTIEKRRDIESGRLGCKYQMHPPAINEEYVPEYCNLDTSYCRLMSLHTRKITFPVLCTQQYYGAQFRLDMAIFCYGSSKQISSYLNTISLIPRSCGWL